MKIIYSRFLFTNIFNILIYLQWFKFRRNSLFRKKLDTFFKMWIFWVVAHSLGTSVEGINIIIYDIKLETNKTNDIIL